jgi:hypothetical protein
LEDRLKNYDLAAAMDLSPGLLVFVWLFLGLSLPLQCRQESPAFPTSGRSTPASAKVTAIISRSNRFNFVFMLTPIIPLIRGAVFFMDALRHDWLKCIHRAIE